MPGSDDGASRGRTLDDLLPPRDIERLAEVLLDLAISAAERAEREAARDSA